MGNKKIWQLYILNYGFNQGLANYGLLPVFVNHFIGIQPHPFVYIWPMADFGLLVAKLRYL